MLQGLIRLGDVAPGAAFDDRQHRAAFWVASTPEAARKRRGRAMGAQDPTPSLALQPLAVVHSVRESCATGC